MFNVQLLYMRLVKINRDRVLYSAFTTDQDLAQENSKCWFSTWCKYLKYLISKIWQIIAFLENNKYYHQQSDSQLQKI